jgi:hypothetical protein
MSASAVERININDIDPKEFYQKFRKRGWPVVITGALKGVPDWSAEFLAKAFGAYTWPARHYGADHFDKPKREWKRYSALLELPFLEYLAMLADRRAHREHIYMAQILIGQLPAAAGVRPVFDALARHAGMVPLLTSDISFWLGHGGHVEPLHFDMGEGTLLQMHGSKRVTLFPPGQSANLYPFPFGKGGIPPWFAQVDIAKPDDPACPNLRKALEHRIDVILDQGEVLFIPAFWWHEVEALGRDYACSLNRFWKVEPVWRNFTTVSSSILYLMNSISWDAVLWIDRQIRRRQERTAAAAAGMSK